MDGGYCHLGGGWEVAQLDRGPRLCQACEDIHCIRAPVKLLLRAPEISRSAAGYSYQPAAKTMEVKQNAQVNTTKHISHYTHMPYDWFKIETKH